MQFFFRWLPVLSIPLGILVMFITMFVVAHNKDTSGYAGLGVAIDSAFVFVIFSVIGLISGLYWLCTKTNLFAGGIGTILNLLILGAVAACFVLTR